MKIAVIGPTLNTYYGIEEIARNNDIKALFTLPQELGIKKARYTSFEDQANKYGFEIFYDENNLKDDKVIKRFKDLNLDLIVELGSSKMIPRVIIESARYGCIGSHGGKLPYIKGGASMNWALINGEKEWGVSIYYLNSNIDDGILIKTEEFIIEDYDDINTIHDKSDLATANMLGYFLENFKLKNEIPKNNKLETIKIRPSKIDFDWDDIIKWNREVKDSYKDFKNFSNKAIFMPHRKPQDGFIDLNSSNKEIYDFIRAQIKPFPGAFTLYKNKKVLIFNSNIENSNNNDAQNGQIINLDKNGIFVNTKTGSLLIKRIQMENMPEMWGSEFSNYYNLKMGDLFVKF